MRALQTISGLSDRTSRTRLTPALPGRADNSFQTDYRKILEQNPRYPSIHFRLARLLLSKPNPAPDFAEQAKKELQAELAIDPANAGAGRRDRFPYIMGGHHRGGPHDGLLLVTVF